MVNIYPLVKKCLLYPPLLVNHAAYFMRRNLLIKRGSVFDQARATWMKKPFYWGSPYCYEPSLGQDIYLRKYRFKTQCKRAKECLNPSQAHWVFLKSLLLPFSYGIQISRIRSEWNLTAFFFDLNKIWTIFNPNIAHWMGRMLWESFLKTWLFKGL